MCGRDPTHYAEYWKAVQELWLRFYLSHLVVISAINVSVPAPQPPCLLTRGQGSPPPPRRTGQHDQVTRAGAQGQDQIHLWKHGFDLACEDRGCSGSGSRVPDNVGVQLGAEGSVPANGKIGKLETPQGATDSSLLSLRPWGT